MLRVLGFRAGFSVYRVGLDAGVVTFILKS